jgi:malate dehydrogenase (oxaloacetate-decarboxylating)
MVTDDMLIAAARALAGVVSTAELGPHYIIPSVFNPNVTAAVAAAVRDAAVAARGGAATAARADAADAAVRGDQARS